MAAINFAYVFKYNYLFIDSHDLISCTPRLYKYKTYVVLRTNDVGAGQQGYEPGFPLMLDVCERVPIHIMMPFIKFKWMECILRKSICESI